MFGKKKKGPSSRYEDENRRYYRQETVPKRPAHARYYNQRSYERQRGSSRYEAREMMYDDDARYERAPGRYADREDPYVRESAGRRRSGAGERGRGGYSRRYDSDYAYERPVRRKKRHMGLKIILTDLREDPVKEKVFHYDIQNHVLSLETEPSSPIELLSEQDEARYVDWLDGEIFMDYTTLENILDAAGIPVEIRVDWENERIYIDTLEVEE